MDLLDMLEQTKTKEDFILFVEKLRQDLKENPVNWENTTLDDFLEAIGRWTEDSDGYYKNMGKPEPQNVPWKAFAQMLFAASAYE